MRTWRIATVAHAAFDGEGARRYGSRWTPQGVAAVYASATLSLAALERFVHTDPDLEPDDLVAVLVEVDDTIPIQSLDIGQLPADWRQYPAPDTLGRLGGEWLTAAGTAILAVPSAVREFEQSFGIAALASAPDTGIGSGSIRVGHVRARRNPAPGQPGEA